MSPCGIAGAAADLSSGMSVISAWVVSRSEAIDAAFSIAARSNLGRVEDSCLEHVHELHRFGVEAPGRDRVPRQNPVRGSKWLICWP
jgi:hypothetical protein